MSGNKYLDISVANSGKNTSKETNGQSTNWFNIHIGSSTHCDTTLKYMLNAILYSLVARLKNSCTDQQE